MQEFKKMQEEVGKTQHNKGVGQQISAFEMLEKRKENQRLQQEREAKLKYDAGRFRGVPVCAKQMPSHMC